MDGIYWLKAETDVPAKLRELGESDGIAIPDWHDRDFVHNWKTHIDHEDKDRWQTLSAEAKGLLYVVAQALASEEIWD